MTNKFENVREIHFAIKRRQRGANICIWRNFHRCHSHAGQTCTISTIQRSSINTAHSPPRLWTSQCQTSFHLETNLQIIRQQIFQQGHWTTLSHFTCLLSSHNTLCSVKLCLPYWSNSSHLGFMLAILNF